MVKEDLISVIIPAYNHEKYIGETIRSLIFQSYKNVELIIVNDGSRDNTSQVIHKIYPECEKRFVDFEYVNKHNEGVIKTLNKGLSLASGKFIYIIASDDSAEPDALKILHEFISKNSDYGLVVGDNYIIDDNGNRCFWNQNLENVYKEADAKFSTFGEKLKDYRKDIDFNSEEFGSYRSLLKGNYIPNGYLIRKDILDFIGGYSEVAPLEDYYMMMQVSKISKMKFIDQPLYGYRWHSSNTIKQAEKIITFTEKTLKLEEQYTGENGFKSEFIRAVGYKKKYGIPFLFEISKTVNAFKERVIFRIFGIRIMSSIKTYDQRDTFENIKYHVKVIKIIGIPFYKKYENV